MALRLLGHSPGGWTLLGHSPGLVDTFSDTLQEWQVPLIRLLTLSCCSVTFSIIFFKLCSHIHMHFCDVGFPPLLGHYPGWQIPPSETLQDGRTPFRTLSRTGTTPPRTLSGLVDPPRTLSRVGGYLLGFPPGVADTPHPASRSELLFYDFFIHPDHTLNITYVIILTAKML